MSQTKGNIVVINPYDEAQIAKMKEFEQELQSNFPLQPSEILTQIAQRQSKEAYEMEKRLKNEVEENLFLEVNGSYKVSCFIDGYKDRAECSLDLAYTPDVEKTGYIATTINLAYEYAVNQLGMQNISVKLPQRIAKTENIAKKTGFEPILQNDTTVYLEKAAPLEKGIGISLS